MFQPPHTKSEKRKSLNAQVRTLLGKNAIRPPELKEVYGMEDQPEPRLEPTKKRRLTQGANATMLSPPFSPSKFPSATPSEFTVRKKRDAQHSSLARSLSAPRRSQRVSKITSESATSSPSAWQDTGSNTSSGAHMTTTTTATAIATSATATSVTATQGHDMRSTALTTSSQRAPATSSKTAAQTVTKSNTPGSIQTPLASPAKSGQSKHVKSISSPARIEKPKDGKVEPESPNLKTLKPKKKLITWVEKGRRESSQFHLQFDQLGDLILPGIDVAAEEAPEPNSWHPASPPKGSPRKLAHHQRSINLPERIYVVSAPPLIPHPPQASGWISETHYSKLSREAQVMIAGFSAVKDLYEMGSKTFGSEWTFRIGHDEPLRNWAQRGEVKRGPERECEYFCRRKNFEAFYANGELAQHFKEVIADINKLSTGLERTQSILKLAKQGDHVLNLALETLYSLTLRTDYKPEELIQAWDCMVYDKPGRKELGFLRAYLDQNCITVQAFVNAFLWQFETMRQHMVPSVGMRETLQTFYFFAPNFLGYPGLVLHKLKAKHTIDQHNEALKKFGAQDVATKLNELARKRKDALSLLDVAKSLEPQVQSDNEFVTEFHAVNAISQALVQKLVSGDQRFANAIGLECITDPPSPLQALEPVTPTPPPLSTLPSHGMPASTTVLPSLPPSPIHGNQ